MDPLLQYPQVNGFKTSFCSIEMKVMGGIQLPGIKSINYGEPLSSSTVYGSSAYPQGETRGQLKGAGSIEVYQDQYYSFINALTLNGARGFADGFVPITVTFAETGMITISDFLPKARIHSPDQSHSEGTEALTVKLTMNILMPIAYGGVAGARFQLKPYTIR
jgi:hypothetical protein